MGQTQGLKMKGRFWVVFGPFQTMWGILGGLSGHRFGMVLMWSRGGLGWVLYVSVHPIYIGV